MPTRKAIVLLSGGLDSSVALWWAKRQGYRCYALSFDYGQRHKKELRSAKVLANLAKVPLRIIRFGLPWSTSSLTNKKFHVPHRSLSTLLSSSLSSTYVPGRNTIFLSFALSWADEVGAEAIVIGANAIDYSGYPDCRGTFLRAFEKVARLGSRLRVETSKHLRVEAPLLHLTKTQIIKLGQTLGVPLPLTWSCYVGGRRPCGRCDSCLLRKKGFDDLKK